MNYMMETPVPVTERDFEELSMLAEDVMQTLYMRYHDFDEEGNEILMKYYKGRTVSDETWEQETEILPVIPDIMMSIMTGRAIIILMVRYTKAESFSYWDTMKKMERIIK